jgi:predicted AAA+ superfamily ATPase
MIERYISGPVRKDLLKKMVFVAGPRQVGKTTFAKSLLPDPAGYLGWDIAEHREAILRRELPSVPMLAFDELHKYRSWRAYLKGLFDSTETSPQILVTGSARLDYYRFGGDSLQGRYHLHRLHPLSFAEVSHAGNANLKDLLMLGGFPEPFFSGSEVDARRWSREYRTRLLQEDIAALEKISDLGNLELLILRLPQLVGAPLSLNALREDLSVSHDSIRLWLAALERMYAIVRIPPFGASRIRAVKKSQKHYQYDWTLVPDLPRRFENLIAMHLLKWVHFKQDTEGLDLELRYFRDVDLREVDFVVTQDSEPILLVEAKWSDAPVEKGLRYLKARFPRAAAWQVSAEGSKDYQSPEGIRVAPAERLLEGME